MGGAGSKGSMVVDPLRAATAKALGSDEKANMLLNPGSAMMDKVLPENSGGVSWGKILAGDAFNAARDDAINHFEREQDRMDIAEASDKRQQEILRRLQLGSNPFLEDEYKI